MQAPQMQMAQNPYALPAHMDDDQKIVLQARHGQRHRVEQVERGSISMFSQQMASLVGPAYVGAFWTGAAYSLFARSSDKVARTRRLQMNQFFNNLGKTSTRWGNNSAAAVLLYIITGKFINFFFQEEFDDFNIRNTYDNAIYGGVAGAIYKCTRGKRPMVLGAILGSCCGSFYGYLWRNKFFYAK